MSSGRRRLAAELRAPFRLVFGGARQPEAEPESVQTPDVEFVAYAEDCTLSGRIELAEERLSDLLNAHESFQLVDVLVTPLDGAPPIELAELLIARDELLFVQATGPRGNPERRLRTHQHRVVISAKPYEIRGDVHVIPGSDPVESFRRRRSMVAMTNAVVRYPMAGSTHEREAGTLIINRDVIDWIAEADDKPVATLGVPWPSGTPDRSRATRKAKRPLSGRPA